VPELRKVLSTDLGVHPLPQAPRRKRL